MPETQQIDLHSLPLPRPERAEVVARPDGSGPGHWVGAPSAVYVDGVYYLAYRVRAPVGEGRGGANVVARSTDGVHFETLCEVSKEEFGAESLERPALVRTPEGRWRLYVSCATPDSKHWRVELLEADDPAQFDAQSSRTVLPGSDELGVKDTVVRHFGGQWHLWASVHPLERWDDADRMTSEYATSPDGVDWTWQGTALAGKPDTWDSRGARITAVLPLAGPGGGDRLLALYDGRASAEENWEERTGVAWGVDPGTFEQLPNGPAVQSPYGLHGLRYADIVPLPDGGHRLYYELAREDGAHELVTELWESGAAS